MTKHFIIAVPLLLLWASFFPAISPAQLRLNNSELRRIKELADARDDAKLLLYLSQSPELAEAALTALASVQAETAAKAISEKLSDPTPAVRRAAAFALGQTLRDAKPETAIVFEPAALKRLIDEPDAEVKAELLDATGRFGSTAALENIITINFAGDRLQQAQAKSIARFAIRGLRSKAAAGKALSLFTREPFGDSTSFAIYALSRYTDAAMLEGMTEKLRDAVRSPNPSVRMHAAIALGRTKTDAALLELLRVADDSDERVSLTAIRAFASCKPSDAARQPEFLRRIGPALVKALNSEKYLIVKAAVQVLPQLELSSTVNAAVASAVQKLFVSPSEDLQNEAMQTYARAFPQKAALELAEQQRSHTAPAGMIEMVGILAEQEKRTRPVYRDWLSKYYLTSENPKVLIAAIGAWGKCWKAARLSGKASDRAVIDMKYEEPLLNLMKKNAEVVAGKNGERAIRNVSVVVTVAGVFSDSLLAQEKYAAPVREVLELFPQILIEGESESVMALMDALASMKDLAAIETLQRYITVPSKPVRTKANEALKKMGAAPMSQVRETPPLPHDWAWMARFTKNPVAVFETSKGTITAELFIGETTFTVENFVALAERKFYDGLLFHRVVPNFVVQGGDPRGDGSGGPPYAIRSELTERSYERGMIGMASAGKDTEGSQFFFMHSHHPHLDGRYTLFGKVISGMNVVDKLEVGDKLLSVKVQ
ncbi:MAG: peptidylprolyl isomerase [Rhizobacter sp.]|nr:peptidylprolyl isomerase [Chlorobiales bacterium]